MAENNYTCAHCGGMITPRINKTTGLLSKATRKYCSPICASRHHDKTRAKRVKPRGKPKPKPVTCEHCKKTVLRHVRSSRDAGKYCSRDCSFAALAHMRREREALLRIGRNARRHTREAGRAQRVDEIAKAKAAAIAVKLIRACLDCGSMFQQRTHIGTPEKRCQRCESIVLKAARKTGKLSRKAKRRGAVSESINPIKVFERDKWKCHLCGVKTLKSKRGTYDDRAPELEHIVALADGGSHTWGNVACSCRKCNGTKGARSLGQLGLGIAA